MQLLQLLVDVKINVAGLRGCVIFVILREFRNQTFPLEVLSLPAWLTEACALVIPIRPRVPAIYL